MRTMRARLATVGAVAVFAGMLVAVSAGGPAVAAVPAKNAKGDRILIAPPAPASAQPAAEMGIAAVEPDTTPGVTSHPVAPGEVYTCGAGYFCPLVWNYRTNKWKVFFMYYCRWQALQNWIGDGAYLNNQIPPGGTAELQDEDRDTLAFLVVENPRRQRPWNWTPVWFIKPC